MPGAEKKNIFRPLDRDAEVQITLRNLPHWFQSDAAMFITFRTADSLPKSAILRMIAELQTWLWQRGLPAELANSTFEVKHINHEEMLAQLTSHQAGELKFLTSRLFHRSLDECHGQCVLKTQELAEIVANAIRYYDTVRYDLDSFIVMPNHVHVIVQFRQGYNVKTVSQSWLRYTARLINQALGQEGAFWQPEPFDHIIRNQEQFRYLHKYIKENPEKAKLRDGEYLYWNS